jgi:O-antigen/teichoic acid export membrane protein
VFISKIKKYALRSDFSKSVTVLAGGTVFAQSLSLIASPVLTRLYSPTDFGILAVFISLLSVISVVASLRYEVAIPIPDSKEDAFALVAISLLILVGTVALTALSVGFFGDFIATHANVLIVKPYLWLLPIGMAFTGAYQVLSSLAIRQRNFRLLANTKINQSITLVICQLVFGIINPSALYLLASNILGSSAGVYKLSKGAYTFFTEIEKSHLLKRFKYVALRYIRYPLIFGSSSLLNAVGLNLPALLLAYVYSPQVVGWYGFAQRVIALPMTMVGQSVAQVYIGEAALLRREHPKGLRPLFLNTTKKLLMLGAPPLLLLGMVGPQLFKLVFGENWQEAGIMMQVMVPMFIAQFVVVPISQTLIILERQSLQGIWDAIRLTIIIAIFIIANRMAWSYSLSIAMYSLAMTICYVGLFFLSYYALNAHRST